MLNMDGPDGNQFYWHDLRKEPDSFMSRQFGGGSVMVWAPLRVITGNQDSAAHIFTLSEFLQPYAHLDYGTDFYLLRDGASSHRSYETKDFLDEQGIRALDWAARSPDLNPIENLWGSRSERGSHWMERWFYACGNSTSSRRKFADLTSA
ncbi:TPA: hypothetical protein N0F65_001381 [Lagenidium giganteum]|uniref:Transposase n=1 Tax=Lagenidium giganteum TaxID=4803 RepID=A0AAV2YWB5_9STRA|nr:TPA: hypothetical protein N0F65_001381 [Lagenidium giganteum]